MKSVNSILIFNFVEDTKKITHNKKMEKSKNHLSKAAQVVLWIAVGSIILMTIIWLWHLICPTGWHYLTTEQKDKLETLLLSSALTKIALGYYKDKL